MNKLDVNALGVSELSMAEMEEIDGGGDFSWGEAAVAFLLLGAVGVGFYYLGTLQS